MPRLVKSFAATVAVSFVAGAIIAVFIWAAMTFGPWAVGIAFLFLLWWYAIHVFLFGED